MAFMVLVSFAEQLPRRLRRMRCWWYLSGLEFFYFSSSFLWNIFFLQIRMGFYLLVNRKKATSPREWLDSLLGQFERGNRLSLFNKYSNGNGESFNGRARFAWNDGSSGFKLETQQFVWFMLNFVRINYFSKSHQINFFLNNSLTELPKTALKFPSYQFSSSSTQKKNANLLFPLANYKAFFKRKRPYVHVHFPTRNTIKPCKNTHKKASFLFHTWAPKFIPSPQPCGSSSSSRCSQCLVVSVAP